MSPLVLILSVTVLICAITLSQQRVANAGKGGLSEKSDLPAIRAAMSKVTPLHRKKTPPEESDWLANHKEPGQTFEQYLKSNPNRPTERRRTIYILPLGNFDKTQSRLIDETHSECSRG